MGLLFLTGLYISSVSSGMGGIYGAPRILQCIANDGTIPVIRVLSKGVCVRSLLVMHSRQLFGDNKLICFIFQPDGWINSS